MTDPKNEMNLAGPLSAAVDPQRRSFALALFGALGGAALSGCRVSAEDARPEDTAMASAALAGDAVVKYAGSVAELRSLSGGASGWIALLTGYSCDGDGGGGMFYWDPIAAVDDGGTVLNEGSRTTGGWRRLWSGAVDIRWLGAIPGLDTSAVTTANVTAIRRAIDLVSSSGGKVLITGGTFFIDDTIAMRGRVSVVLEGPAAPSSPSAHQSALKWSARGASGATMLAFENCARCAVRGLLIDGAGIAGIGVSVVALAGAACDDGLFEDFQITSTTAIGLRLGLASGGSCADNTFRRFLITNCPIGIEQDGTQTSDTVYDGTLVAQYTKIGIHVVRGDATVRNVDFASADPGAGTTYDVQVDDSALCMRFENNNHELQFTRSVAYYFPPRQDSPLPHSSSRISFTKLDGVRVLWLPAGGPGKIIDYQQEGPVVAVACQWIANSVLPPGAVTVDWIGAARSTLPIVQELGCQYVQGITANPGSVTQYFSSLVSNGAFGSAVGLGLNNGAIQFGSTGYGVPSVAAGGGALYVMSGALWFVGPGGTPTKLAQG